MLQLLKSTSFLNQLTEPELVKIFAICRTQTFQVDDTICREGEAGDCCYLITRGAVRVSKHIPNIGEEALKIIRFGECFGEMSLIDNYPRSATVTANEETDVVIIHKKELDDILSKDHELGYKIYRAFTHALSNRLRDMNERLAAFLSMSVGF